MLRVRFFSLIVAIIIPGFSLAYADEPSRDEDVFGEESRENDMFGEGEGSESDAETRLDEKLEAKQLV